jgi:hypothetical protein
MSRAGTSESHPTAMARRRIGNHRGRKSCDFRESRELHNIRL